jgi:hypothetical protein
MADGVSGRLAALIGLKKTNVLFQGRMILLNWLLSSIAHLYAVVGSFTAGADRSDSMTLWL